MRQVGRVLHPRKQVALHLPGRVNLILFLLTPNLHPVLIVRAIQLLGLEDRNPIRLRQRLRQINQ
ncbi:hypothetical protein ED971_21830 [Salmonella enterica]|nr:hypothetical protein [Salmonella enterica]EBM5796359.1 hypothetical protein [Salmonella enterica]MFE40857.1 hypothetical protein [Salmonella enterica]